MAFGGKSNVQLVKVDEHAVSGGTVTVSCEIGDVIVICGYGTNTGGMSGFTNMDLLYSKIEGARTVYIFRATGTTISYSPVNQQPITMVFR